jgi:hypothetical protein
MDQHRAKRYVQVQLNMLESPHVTAPSAVLEVPNEFARLIQSVHFEEELQRFSLSVSPRSHLRDVLYQRKDSLKGE